MCIIHKWNKYGYVIDEYSSKQCQYKKCEKCGKIKYRKISEAIGVAAKQINDSLSEVDNVSKT